MSTSKPRATRRIFLGVAFVGVAVCALGAWAVARPEPTRPAPSTAPITPTTNEATRDARVASRSDAAVSSVVFPPLPTSVVASLVRSGLAEDDVARAVAALHTASSVPVAPVAAACVVLPSGEYDVVMLTRRYWRGALDVPATFVRVRVRPGRDASNVRATPIPRAFVRGEISSQSVEHARVGLVDVDHDGVMEGWVALHESMQSQMACCETAERAAREWTVTAYAVRAHVFTSEGALLAEKILLAADGDRGYGRYLDYDLLVDVESPRAGAVSFVFSCSPGDGLPSCRDGRSEIRWRVPAPARGPT